LRNNWLILTLLLSGCVTRPPHSTTAELYSQLIPAHSQQECLRQGEKFIHRQKHFPWYGKTRFDTDGCRVFWEYYRE
jgi:hypothetical protein